MVPFPVRRQEAVELADVDGDGPPLGPALTAGTLEQPASTSTPARVKAMRIPGFENVLRVTRWSRLFIRQKSWTFCPLHSLRSSGPALPPARLA